jgi:Asp-tRNA(Asn)/Glu-tRNA(Gln) amidotransferase B subunit
MSITSLSLKSPSGKVTHPDENLDKLMAAFESSQIISTGLPVDVWRTILNQLSWKDLKKAELTCKQIFLAAQRIFKQGREDHACFGPEVRQWPIQKLISFIENQTLYPKNSAMLTFVGIAEAASRKKLCPTRGLILPSDIHVIIDQVLANNPALIADFKAGNNKAFAFLLEQALKASHGKASPNIVNDILLKKLT